LRAAWAQRAAPGSSLYPRPVAAASSVPRRPRPSVPPPHVAGPRARRPDLGPHPQPPPSPRSRRPLPRRTLQRAGHSRADRRRARRPLERCRKQQLARTTAAARQDPLVRTLLDEAFERLGLLDPERHLRVAIARYPLDVVVDAVAIFEAKRRVHMLPQGVDARYLLGIARNLGDAREGIAIAETLLRARLDARDRLLAPLVQAREAARLDTPDLRARVLRFVDLALAANRCIDRLFWL